MITNVHKRRISTKEEFLFDFKEETQGFFKAFQNAKLLYEAELIQTPREARVRSFAANLLNCKMVQCLQEEFIDRFRFGKYKRVVGYFIGYQILIKKVTKKGLPMSIPTKMSKSIFFQENIMLSLFDNTKETQDAIVFFGYQLNKWGDVCLPQFVCIDEGKLIWKVMLDDMGDISNVNLQSINGPSKPVIVAPTLKKGQGKEAI